MLQEIPLSHLRPSTTEAQQQRRKAFNKAAIAELAESIKTNGVVQAIVVRKVNGERAAGVSVPAYYEIVAGERRVLAAGLAKLETIPANVRELTDEQVVEIQLIENLQREDLHPMHEAESYDELVHKYKHAVDELTARIGKSRSYVYGRLKLLALSAKARKAFYEGLLSPSVAEKLARVPSHKLQDEALPELTGTKFADGSPLSFREAVEFIEANLMLELKGAPFDVTDPDLNNAGPCGKCPKRTGNAPDLFGDIKNADVCTDLVCFNAKARAWGQRQVELAKQAGRSVIAGAAAKKVAPNGVERDDPLLTGGYRKLDGTTYADGYGYKAVKVKTLLKPDAKTELLHDGASGRVIEVVHESQLKKQKRESRPADPYVAKRREQASSAKTETAVRHAVFKAIAAKGKWKAPSLRVLAELVVESLDYDAGEALRKLLALPERKSSTGFYDFWGERVKALKTDAELGAFIAQAYLAGELHVNSYDRSPTMPRLEAAAKAARVDVSKIRRELAPKKKSATGKKAKRR